MKRNKTHSERYAATTVGHVLGRDWHRTTIEGAKSKEGPPRKPKEYLDWKKDAGIDMHAGLKWLTGDREKWRTKLTRPDGDWRKKTKRLSPIDR